MAKTRAQRIKKNADKGDCPWEAASGPPVE